MTSGKRTYLADIVEAVRARGFDVEYDPDTRNGSWADFYTTPPIAVFLYALDGFLPDDHAHADVRNVETGEQFHRFFDAPELYDWLDRDP